MLNELIEINEYKSREFLGDALLKLIVGELVFDIMPKDKFQKRSLMWKVAVITCNDNLSIVAQELGLYPHPFDNNKKQNPLKPRKVYANAYEAFIYDMYLKQGMSETKKFIKETLIENKHLKV